MVSTYGEGIINRLHPNSPLRQEGNPARTLIMKTIGAWLDNYDVTELYDASFLETATGRWLDLYGNDLSVPRRLDESDEDYRTRLIYESIGNLSIDYLLNVFDLSLYSFRVDFDIGDNTLVSDNLFLNTGGYIGVAEDDVISVVDRKLLLDGSISWVNTDGENEYIFDTRGKNILSNYSEIYKLTKVNSYFRKNEGIENVKLFLPNATNCVAMFTYCANLVNVELFLPNATNCVAMFTYCVNLVNVKLNLPNLNSYTNMFSGIGDNLKTIDVTIPTSQVDGFKTMVYSATPRLTQLTSFKINGEEQL